jgi:predicted DNA binding CopG/RHH family protein
MAKLKILSVRLPEELIRSLRLYTAEQGITIQGFIEGLLSKRLGR